jgi:hypothetical protein
MRSLRTAVAPVVLLVATLVAGCSSAADPDPAQATARTVLAAIPSAAATPASTAGADPATEANAEKVCQKAADIYAKGIVRITAAYASATDSAGRARAAKQTKKALDAMANQLNSQVTSVVDESARNAILVAIYQVTAAAKSKDAAVVSSPEFLAIGQKLATDCHATVNP